MSLDPDELRAFAKRDWAAPEQLARRARSNQSVDLKVKIAIDLYECMRRTRPEWPTEAQRREDMTMHLRLRELLDRAAHVGSR